MTSLYRKLIIIPILALMLCGCKEKGEITQAEKVFYYNKASYEDQVFTVYKDEAFIGGHKVDFGIEETEAPYIHREAGTFASLELTDEEYTDLIGGYKLFEASLDVITVLDPATGRLYTYLSDDVRSCAAKSANSPGYIAEIEDMEGYIRDNRMVYLEL